MFPKKIIIAGGGTAGWMSASLLQHSWPESDIVLIESENIGTIGVGEGSTPGLRNFFKTLNISEQEWMPFCNATFKSGIEFPNWSVTPGYESYFHPFFSSLDSDTGKLFFKLAKEQKSGFPNNAHPDHFFISKQIAYQNKAPKSLNTQNFRLDYGYHFDAGLLAIFLKKRCLNLGLKHISDDITDVKMNEFGEIKELITNKNNAQSADLYIDCTGFRALIIQQTLKSEFISFSDNLFNDRAVAIQTPKTMQSSIRASTKSTALSNGWAWEIPLTNRYGNGYVYSSSFISPDQAEQELRTHLNIGDKDDVKVRHLAMKIGRIDKHWNKNCLAVGLSQGFIEPLEATALMLVQFTLETFIEQYTVNQQEQIKRQFQYNSRINMTFEGIRDYIVTHYKTNSRSDSEYWLKCRENNNISNNLSALLDAWKNPNPNVFEDELNKQGDSSPYLRASWFVILAGMGQFPHQALVKNNAIKHHQRAQKHCTEFVEKSFLDHRQYLDEMK
mgnify:FL=1|jgi:hypothetical protein|tara:strand:+ start:1843 stop:3345 length:1503 start_codon:yes stop_codon:yes gene_type:complete